MRAIPRPAKSLLALCLLAPALAGCDEIFGSGDGPALEIAYGFFPENSILQADLYLASADGERTRRLTSLAGVETEPSWSPDGRRIAFERIVYGDNFLAPDTQAVYVVSADGSGIRPLVTGPGIVQDPAWSPDGSRIAYSFRTGGGGSGIALVNADGTGAAPVPNTVGGHSPAWAPDGARLVFARSLQIWIIDASGGNARRLTTDACGTDPAWSPDGARVAYSCGEEVVVVNASNGGLVRRFPVEARNGIAWSPESDRLVFDGRRAADFDLFVLDVSDGTTVNLSQTAGQFEVAPDWRR